MQNGKNLATMALVFGILGIVLGGIPYVGVVMFVLSIIGLVFGIKALNMIKLTGDESYKGLAIAGLICSVVGIVFGIFGLACTASSCLIFLAAMGEA